MPTKLAWRSDTSRFLRASAGGPSRGAQWLLVVEVLPKGGWDWQVWTNDGSGRGLHGIAVNASAAMGAAADAVRAFQLASLPVVGTTMSRSLN